jgi:hypothetical protein
MQTADPELIPLTEVHSGDVLLYRESTLKVLQSVSAAWPGAWKLTYRNSGEPMTARPTTMWLRRDGRVHRLMSSAEIAARQAAGRT